MCDPLFEQYQARGLASRETVIISKENRDADPLTCQEGRFTGAGNGQDWVELKGAR